MRPLILALLLVTPFATGCLSGDDDAPAAAPAVAQSATEAGAQSGPAPVAPKDAYLVAPDAAAPDATVVAYPVAMKTNAAKAPVELDLSGAFEPRDCRPLRFGDQEAMLGAVSAPFRFHDLAEEIAIGDVFSYDIAFGVSNSEQGWGELQLTFGIGNTISQTEEPTGDTREPLTFNWTGQGYRASDDDLGFLVVECDYGGGTQPIPYTLTVKLTFSEGSVPAEAPVKLTVPEGATRLFVQGVPVNPEEGVQSHFRLFAPDDTLVCECALGSSADVATIPLEEAGDYVLLVDHTHNGFVSVALDAPAAEPMTGLATEWVRIPTVGSDGAAVDQTIDVDIPRVPLHMHAMVLSPEGGMAGVGKKTSIVVANGRGEPLSQAWGGHLTWEMPEGTAWLGYWPDDWAFNVDHHSFAPGKHTVTVKAEGLRGMVYLMTRQYVR